MNNTSFNWSARVYYEDTDAGGVVYYANYLRFFERARTEWLRAAGIDQQQLVIDDKIAFVVKKIAVDYHAPARLDDELNLSVAVERVGRASVHFSQRASICNGDQLQLLTSCSVKIGCVSLATFRAIELPDHVLDRIVVFQNR